MTANEEKNAIDRVFAELKAKGLVAAKRKLKRKKAAWSHDFKAGILRPKNISIEEMETSMMDSEPTS